MAAMEERSDMQDVTEESPYTWAPKRTVAVAMPLVNKSGLTRH